MPNTKIVSLTAKFQMLKELCSRTSKTVVSSTYLALIFQSLKRVFIIIENRATSILVPWGIPPWVCFMGVFFHGFYWSEKTLSEKIE